MKILIVSQYFWPENFRVNDLAESLQRDGHSVTALTGMPNYPSGKLFPDYSWWRIKTEKYNGVTVFRVPLIPRGKGGAVRLFFNYLSFALTASLLGPFLCRKKYDVIFVHEPSPITVGIPAIVMKLIKKAPILFWVLDLWPESIKAAAGIKSEIVLQSVGKMVRFIYERCDLILVQSRAFVPQVAEFCSDKRKIHYFPSWAESLYRPLARSKSHIQDLALHEDTFYVMFAGNVGASQDFSTILHAAEILKRNLKIQWLIVGDGRLFSWLKEQVRERGLEQSFHLLGRYPLEEMPGFFSKADAMLVSLKKEPIFSLTIPGKIQSYLACGRPIIAMLDGEGAMIVEEAGAGISCPPECADALVQAVVQMSEMPSVEREAMGMLGWQYYLENFERKMLFEKLEKLMLHCTAK